jgi:hypothetical protein
VLIKKFLLVSDTWPPVDPQCPATDNLNLIGQVSALFAQKNQLISKIFPDQPCPYNRANLYQCINREI